LFLKKYINLIILICDFHILTKVVVHYLALDLYCSISLRNLFNKQNFKRYLITINERNQLELKIMILSDFLQERRENYESKRMKRFYIDLDTGMRRITESCSNEERKHKRKNIMKQRNSTATKAEINKIFSLNHN